MKKLTDDELSKAFTIWRLRYYEPKDIEQELVPFLNSQMKPFAINQQEGWLKRARHCLFMSAESVAKKMGVSRAAYSKYEECEEAGSITLATLAKAAEAMDCELVYAIRPKKQKSFSRIIWNQLLQVSMDHPWIQKCDPKRRGAALAAIAKKYMKDPKFRKKQAWSQRGNHSTVA